ncbi:DUF411 domain-containing protein [Halomonas sp. BC2]|uniref:DUF411 domain-containing protein n=1 Tax=unclassified Halomonas TaxID=2609666 RepID=UPI001482C139|nr:MULTISPECIES: DUF411 domain-containing protein [unclassified Halomonas]
MSKKRLIMPLSMIAGLAVSLSFAQAAPVIEVHSDPHCGCCSDWVSHLEEAGFEVDHHRHDGVRTIKIEHGVTPELASCHTALVEGYVIEGHVPAADIQRLLEERPAIAGLAVPGMPHGSPGMETGRVDDYAVLGFTHDARPPAIFSEYLQP